MDSRCFLAKEKQVSGSSAPIFAFQLEKARVGDDVRGAWQGVAVCGAGWEHRKSTLRVSLGIVCACEGEAGKQINLGLLWVLWPNEIALDALA